MGGVGLIIEGTMQDLGAGFITQHSDKVRFDS